MDLMAVDPPAVPVTGVRPVERAAGIDFRWLTGPAAALSLTLDQPRRLRLAFTASNPFPGQSVTVIAAGRQAAVFADIPAAPRLTGFTRYEAEFEAPTGTSLLELRFARYNRRSPEDTFAPEDKDALALLVSSLTVTPASR